MAQDRALACVAGGIVGAENGEGLSEFLPILHSLINLPLAPKPPPTAQANWTHVSNFFLD